MHWEGDSNARGLKSSWGSEGPHEHRLTLPSLWHLGPAPQALDTRQLSVTSFPIRQEFQGRLSKH